MKATLFPVFLWLTLIGQSVNAQMKNGFLNERYHPLKVSDTVPDYSLINLINYPKETAKISDFRGKLLILDFWDSHCGACVALFPTLMNLQKEFEGKLQIILVNSLEDKVRVRYAFQRRKEIANVIVTLPSVCRDTTIQELFPYSSVPHIVWIDKLGIVRSISQEGAVNRKNIEDLLAGKEVNMIQEIDNADLISPELGKPLFIKENGGEPKQIFGYSIFAKGDDSLFYTWGITSNNKLNIYQAYACACIRDIYRLAYGDRRTYLGIGEVPLNRTILQVKDTTQYVNMINGEFHYDKDYVYQLIAPPTTAENLQSMMQADLKRYIGLNVRWAIRRMKCLVLTAADTSLIVFKGGARKNLFDETMADLNGLPMVDFIERFQDAVKLFYLGPLPIVDETGFKGKMGHISLTADFNNIDALNAALAPYKLRFTLKDRVVNVLVLSEPGYSSAVQGEVND